MAKHKGEVESVTFRPAKGGVVSETTTAYKRGGQGGGPDREYEHETAVHPTHEHAAAHLKSMLGHAYASEEEEKAEGEE